MKSEEKTTPKKPYASPQLRLYGDIRQMTLTSSNAGFKPDATFFALKTA